MSLRTPIARVRGLGAAREGTGHFIAQRLTGIANVLLVLWFVGSALSLAGAGYQDYVAWLSSPVSASLMILLILSAFHHARLGVQVVIEDYVHHEAIKMAALAAVTLVTFLLGALCIVSVLMVALGS